jgi:protein O-mannosyl-transferase
VIAFAASMLFAVHPMMTEAVGYVSGRSEVLCGTFLFLAFLSARRWMRERGARWWFLTMGLWGAALLTKELAAMLPFVLVVYDRLLLDDVGSPEPMDTSLVVSVSNREQIGSSFDKLRTSGRRRLWRLHAPLVGLAIAGGIGRLAIFSYLEHAGDVAIEWRSILDEAKVIWRYVGLLVVPAGQSIYHDVRPIAGVLDPLGLAAAGAILAVLALAWKFRRTDRLVSFGVIWFFLLLIPSSFIVVLGQGEGMAEHRVYLASCGLFLAAGSMIEWSIARLSAMSPRARPLVRAALAVVLLSLAARTVLRNAVWADPVAIWREASDRAPTNWLPRTVLGETLHDAGRHDEAVAAYRAALQLRPKEPFGYLKLGLCLAELGRFDEATATFEQLRSIDPQSTIVSTGLGAVAMIAGQPDRAREYFVKTLENEPRDVVARQWLAVLEEEAGANPAEALRRCEEIQQLAPGKLSNEDCIRRNRARLVAIDPGRPAQR